MANVSAANADARSDEASATGASSDDAGGQRHPLVDEPAPPRMIGSDVVYEGAVWNLRRDTFELGGQEIVREFVDHTGAVAVLALDDDDRVMLIQQYRHPVRTRDWEIPAGLLDISGEDPLAAAQRELAEEADLAADEWAVLSDIFTSPGGSDEGIRIYLARGLHDTGTVFAREHEEADMLARWVPLDDALDAVLARDVKNGVLVTAVLAASVARSRGWATLSPANAAWPFAKPPAAV